MAVIGKIRSKSGWLIVVIGVAMLAFILGDLTGKGNQGPQTGNTVGEINGKVVSISEFEANVAREVNAYISQSGQTPDNALRSKIREQVWNQTVNRIALQEQIDLAGISVSGAELWDIEQGAEPHPYIKQYFSNPETGQFDRARFMQYRKSLDTEQGGNKSDWNSIENQILEERKQQKYINLVNKGLYVTEFQAEQEEINQSKTVDFKYVLKRYATVPDSDVNVNESDLEKIYNENKEDYKQDASRGVEYVVFDILASNMDTAEIVTWFANLKPDFEKADDVKWFVNGQSDTKFNDVYVSKDALSENLVNLFDAQVGTVTNTYLEGGSYKMAKLVESTQRADSVKARHILIKSKGGVEANNAFADSLKTAIENGSDFAALATQFSEDAGSAKLGGNLGWFKEGQMVKPFNDASFNGKTGDLTIVQSQFGTHLIEVLEIGAKSKKVKIAIIERAITPSENTYENAYAVANQFAANSQTTEDFDNSVANQNFTKRIADNLTINQVNIPGIPDARNLVKWSYKANLGDVSGIQEFGDKFVIAKLSKVTEKGYASIDDRRLELEIEAKKAKKAQILVEKLNASSESSIDELASAVGESANQATNVTFAGYSIEGVGREFAVQGTVFALNENKVSQPIEGNQGVYVVEVTNIVEPASSNAELSKNTLSQSFAQRGTYEGINAIKEAAEIVDKRSTIY